MGDLSLLLLLLFVLFANTVDLKDCDPFDNWDDGWLVEQVIDDEDIGWDITDDWVSEGVSLLLILVIVWVVVEEGIDG